MTFDFKNLAKALLTTCLIASSNAQGNSNPTQGENSNPDEVHCDDYRSEYYAFGDKKLTVACENKYGNTGGKIIAAKVYGNETSDDLVAIISYNRGYVVKCATMSDEVLKTQWIKSNGGSRLCTSKMKEVYKLYKENKWGEMPPGYINNISN